VTPEEWDDIYVAVSRALTAASQNSQHFALRLTLLLADKVGNPKVVRDCLQRAEAGTKSLVDASETATEMRPVETSEAIGLRRGRHVES
jgi:hypothetical protein